MGRLPRSARERGLRRGGGGREEQKEEEGQGWHGGQGSFLRDLQGLPGGRWLALPQGEGEKGLGPQGSPGQGAWRTLAPGLPGGCWRASGEGEEGKDPPPNQAPGQGLLAQRDLARGEEERREKEEREDPHALSL